MTSRKGEGSPKAIDQTSSNEMTIDFHDIAGNFNGIVMGDVASHREGQ